MAWTLLVLPERCKSELVLSPAGSAAASSGSRVPGKFRQHHGQGAAQRPARQAEDSGGLERACVRAGACTWAHRRVRVCAHAHVRARTCVSVHV